MLERVTGDPGVFTFVLRNGGSDHVAGGFGLYGLGDRVECYAWCGDVGVSREWRRGEWARCVARSVSYVRRAARPKHDWVPPAPRLRATPSPTPGPIDVLFIFGLRTE